MDATDILLIPQFLDRSGRTVFMMYKDRPVATSTIIREDEPLGSIRFDLRTTESNRATYAEIDWHTPDLLEGQGDN